MATPLEAALEPVWLAYKQGRSADAVMAAKVVVQDFSSSGQAWFALGCAWERAADYLAADKAFAKASRCTEDEVGVPYRVSWRTFQSVVASSIEALPAKLKDSLADVTLVLADYADPELVAAFPDSELLGLFTGPVRAERDQQPEISPVIHVFRRAHEHSCATAKEFRHEVKQTLWHEFGHYLGFGEGELDSMGLG